MRRRSGGRQCCGDDRSAPSISMIPALGGMKPAIMRKVVVLPQPEGPSSDTNSPEASSSVTSETAAVSPKRFERPRKASFVIDGWNGARPPPTPTLPHKGGGGRSSHDHKKTPSPLAEEGWGGG